MNVIQALTHPQHGSRALARFAHLDSFRRLGQLVVLVRPRRCVGEGPAAWPYAAGFLAAFAALGVAAWRSALACGLLLGSAGAFAMLFFDNTYARAWLALPALILCGFFLAVAWCRCHGVRSKDMVKNSLHTLTAVAAFALTAACVGTERIDPTPAELRGNWKGSARCIVTWAEDQRLPIDLTITSEGNVSGTIGTATLVGGYLAKNRGELGRSLGIKTDYVVRGSLDEVVIPGEPVTSKVLFIPFDLTERAGVPRWSGGVTTCKTASGGGKDHAVVATELDVTRSTPGK